MKKRFGFTLVEMVIVLTIISILGMMSTFFYRHARISTYADAVVNELMILGMGVQGYYETYRVLPTSANKPLKNFSEILPFMGPGFKRNKTPVGGMWYANIVQNDTNQCFLYVGGTGVFANANDIFAEVKKLLDAKMGTNKYRLEGGQYRYYVFVN